MKNFEHIANLKKQKPSKAYEYEQNELNDKQPWTVFLPLQKLN